MRRRHRHRWAPGSAEGEVRSVIVAVAVCLAESSGNPNVYLCNPSLVVGDSPISCPSGTTSVDRGLWQINSAAWPQVSNACAFNGQCNGNAAWGLISSHGTNWSAWVTYNNGAWENYLSIARSAISGFTVQFRNPDSNECLAVDANDIGNEGLIWQWGCGANGWLEWQVNGSGDLNTNGDADLELENLNAAECLAVDADDIGNGGYITQFGCGPNGWLEWS